ncbi:hypothetical protein SLEP1_g12075 [Rubroshorea leprosula]|nr:hypothetical protein SLEP1_g12075 [Rubroshorea leprosula]
MENVSHSRPPNKGYHSTFSEKACNDGKLAGKTMYDDVYGGQPRFGVPTLSPRPEDYSEIFGGFHVSLATSIPVLDLPVVDEEEIFFDVRSCGFDYGEVFGGLDGLDFATSYEELFTQSNGGGGDRDGDLNVDSSEEAWIPAENESLSGDSDHSGKNQFSTNGDPYEPIDSSMEFSISYQRSNRDLTNGITCISQLSNPEYTCVLDETVPLKKTEYKNPPAHVHDDGKVKHLRKTLSHPTKRNAGAGVFANNLESNRSYEKVGLLSDEMFVTISEISLKTQPSEVPPPCRPPPILDSKSKGYEDSQTATSGETVGNNSPPYFDVEIDSSSAAAASAAAMKDAMEKAQVKLKSAKELMDRKRAVQNCMEPSSKSDAKDKKEKLSNVVDGSRNVKDKRVQGSHTVEDSGMKPSIRQEKKEVMKNTQAVSNPLEKERAFNVAKMPADEKLGKESPSSQGSDKIDVADEWQEATQFFELVRTDKSKMAFVETGNCSVPVEKTKRNDHQLKAEKVATEALKQQEDSQCKENAIREGHQLEKVLKNLKTAKETCERGGSTARSEAAKGVAHRHKGHEKKGKVARVVIKLEENEVKSRMVQPFENGKKPTAVEESQKCEKQVNGQENEIKFEVQQAVKHKEDEQLRKETSKSMENQKGSNQCQETKDGEKRQSEVFVSDGNDTRLEQAHEQAENEKMMEGAHQQEEKEDKSLKQACELVENEKKEKEADELDEGEMIWRKALEQLENEKGLKQALEWEEKQKERETYPEEENEKRSKQVLEQENNEKKQKLVYERGEIENRIEQDHLENDETEKPLEEAFELEDNNRTLKEAWDGEYEMKRKLTLEQEEYELTGVNEVHLQTEKDKLGEKVRIDEGAHQHMGGEDLTASEEVCKLDSHAKARLGRGPDKICHEQEKAQKTVLVEDSGRMRAKYRDCEKRSDTTEEENLDRKSGFSGMDQDELEHAASQLRKEDVSSLYHQDDSAKKAGIIIGLRNAEKIKSVLSMGSSGEKQGRKPAYELREIGKNFTEALTASNQEEDKDKFVPTLVKESAETGRKIVAAQSSVLEVKGDTPRTTQPVKISENTERREKNVSESLTFKEKETERMKREIELEKERLRKIEEEREREREREKDRMAVDRVTLEAREWGYAEVRERAERAALERATAEARQRAMAEARERLEKASAEAREKSSTDARLRAERAAVERATAEARERAVEKAMAERAAFEARERVGRSVSDKFSTFSRNTGMGTCSSFSDLQNQQFQSTGSFNGSRFSSDYNGVEGESAQRCKARLERYQRTAERAAKALAEKNMRDHLAQREQAERNRLAETLDADVKRWLSGKEGNLRALLSTLQYILGPDSGWQPIPLTEVITSAAVKKAYRKATLSVHPDKLQQRGASIQQKYICEKVFDLLKEAWNKFNSEER